MSLPTVPLMFTAPALEVPDIQSLPTTYRRSSKRNSTVELAAQVASCGLGTLQQWENVSHSPSEFLQSTMQEFLNQHDGGLIDDSMDTCLYLAPTYEDSDIHFSISVRMSGCAGMFVGKAIDEMEAARTGLGAAWYRLLLTALNRGGWTYGYAQADADFEAKKDNCEDDGTEDENSFNELEEFNPGKCLPAALKKKGAMLQAAIKLEADMRLVRAHIDGPFRPLLELAVQLHALTADLLFNHLKSNREDGYGQSLPICVVGFYENDAIGAAFDDFGQYAYQDEIDDVLWCDRIDLERPASLPATFKNMTTYLRYLSIVSRICRTIKPE